MSSLMAFIHNFYRYYMTSAECISLSRTTRKPTHYLLPARTLGLRYSSLLFNFCT